MQFAQTYIDRFWGKVEKTDECWNWRASLTSDGYGAWTYRLPDSKKSIFLRAHRFAWLLTNGKLTPGLELNHICRNKQCVRPTHLEELTHAEHLRKTPGSWAQKYGDREKCGKGHPFTKENLDAWALKRGIRRCTTCRLESVRKWQSENREKMRAAVRRYKEAQKLKKQQAEVTSSTS